MYNPAYIGEVADHVYMIFKYILKYTTIKSMQMMALIFVSICSLKHFTAQLRLGIFHKKIFVVVINTSNDNKKYILHIVVSSPWSFSLIIEIINVNIIANAY